MFNSLTRGKRQLIKYMIQPIYPDHGRWFEVTQILHNCDEAFNDFAVVK
jgi:hypothetical protein